MTSENSPIPESDNTNSETVESSATSNSDELPTEVRSDDLKDVWSAENIVDVALEPQPTEQLKPILEVEPAPSNSTSITADSSEAESVDEPLDEPELFVDSWLDESEVQQPNNNTAEDDAQSNFAQVGQLEQQKANLSQEITELKAEKERMSQQVRVVQDSLVTMVEEGTKELRERKTALRIEIEKLERRQERINQEMRSNFAGSSKELAIRVQGFKEYLVGSLQGLATAAEKLELSRTEDPAPRVRARVRGQENPARGDRDRDRQRGSRRETERGRARNTSGQGAAMQFSESTFADQSRRIRQLLDTYRNNPDYYGSPWQLRRTFEQNQAQKVQEWFFGQGGRGTIDSMGSRLQNILVASAAISILHNLYGDRARVLILTDTPENLGEWRRGLQDCLGISRNNFGANRGVTLFDSPDVLVQRAERLISDKLLPVIVIDETEELLNLSVLKFPVWMAFASSNRSTSTNYLY